MSQSAIQFDEARWAQLIQKSDKNSKKERGLAGEAIWSGHFHDGAQTFLAYHWLMRMDGNFERLLNDEQIGWHAGNWEINKRSIAICLDNDYEKQDPTKQILQTLAAHIRQNYPDIKPGKIIGHCEARQGTTCPGGNFIDGWKHILLSYLDESPTG
jgi:N-acetyl-anhydromuramyl-L-alanine amidase AmpD